jgi:hypothetical protein
MTFHGFMIVEIPFHDQLFVSIHAHASVRDPFPPNKDVPATTEFTHSVFMLPLAVACVNLVQAL